MPHCMANEKQGQLLLHKFNSWQLANLVASIVMVLMGAVYVAKTWSPSSYGYALVNILGDRQSRPDWGQPRPIRSDEWSVVTPLTQATVNNGFERVNRTSLYGEDLRINYGLPIHDWGIVFKPTMWLYGVVNPAYAYSFHWFVLSVLFIFGHAWLLRWLGAGPVVGFALAAGLYFTGFVQFWWNEKGPIFALFPWILLPFSTRLGLVWKAALMYWVAVAWLLTNFYPPVQVTLAFVGFIILLAREPQMFKPATLALLAVATALAAGTAALYLWDYLAATASTIYPGSRVISGGSVPLRFWLSWLLPSVNFDSNFESLIGLNICEIGTVGLYYTLLVLCFMDFMRWRQAWHLAAPQQRRHTLVLGTGLSLMLCWMALPLPSWLGAPLLWNHVQPERMQYAGGLLLICLLFVCSNWLGLRISWVRAATFCSLVLLGWLSRDHNTGQNHIEDLAIVLIALPAIAVGWYWPARAHASLAVASLAAGALLFGNFNPLQPAWPIFNHPPNAKTRAMDQLAAQNEGVLALVDLPGAVGNGLRYKSLSHVTAVPQLDFWRHRFPELPQAEFDTIFNRYAHIRPGTNDVPRLVQADVIGVPVGRFQKTAPARYAAAPPRALEMQGHIDTAVVEKDQWVLTGWGGWTGPVSAHALDVTLASIPATTPTRVLLMRTDLPAFTHRQASALNGFSLRIPLVIGAPKPAICIVARDTSTGRKTLLHNPPGLAYCHLAD